MDWWPLLPTCQRSPWLVRGDWSPWPVWCHHRRGCSVSLGCRLGDVVAGVPGSLPLVGRCRFVVVWPVSVRGWVVDVAGCGRCSLSDVRRWFVAVMWSPWPVCLVWIHRRGCSLDVGWWPPLSDYLPAVAVSVSLVRGCDVAAVVVALVMWPPVVWLVRGDWSPWVRWYRAPVLLPALPGFSNTSHARFFAVAAVRCAPLVCGWVVAVMWPPWWSPW